MFAVIWIPNLSLQSILRMEDLPEGTPVAVLRETAQRSLIYQVNPDAARYGIREGHTVSQAIAKCQHLQVRPRKPLAEKTAKKALFSTLYSLTPLIEITTENRHTLQLSGVPAQQRKDRMHQILETLKDLGFSPKIGVAETVDWAHYAAKCADPLLWIEDEREFFDEVDIRLAVEDEKLQLIFKQWGIRTLGAFARLPLPAVSRRLGKEGISLWQTLHKREQRILQIHSPEEEFIAEIEVEYEVETLEPLLFIVNRLLNQLCLQLKGAFLKAKVLVLELSLSDRSRYRRVFQLPEPTTGHDKLLQVIESHLENLQTASTIKGVRLQILPTDAANSQPQLFQHSIRDPWQLASTLHQLIGLVGSENVGSPKNLNEHLPDSFSMETMASTLEESGREQAPLLTANPLALRRIRPPAVVGVRTRKGMPAELSLGSKAHEIRATRGPWFQSGHWWDKRHWKRIEWDVELEDGSLIRLLHTTGKWYLEGIYG